MRRAWYRPGDVETLRLQTLVALKRGTPARAIAYLAEVPESSPEATWARLTRGRLLKQLFRVREAEAELRACLKLNPNDKEARRELIIILGVERRARDQQDQLWGLHDQGGQPLEALRLLAQAGPAIPAGALSKTADEGLVLEQCLSADPADLLVRAALAYFYRNRGEVDRARSLLVSLLDEHTDNAAARDELLACLIDAGDVEAARAWFDRRADAPDGRFWNLRGQWLLMQDRRDEALASFGKAVQLEPQDPEARYRLGQALQAAGRKAEASEALAWHRRAQELKALVSSISEETPDPAQLARAGRLCALMGRSREARGWYDLVIRLDPSNADARAALGSRDLSAPPHVGEPALRVP